MFFISFEGENYMNKRTRQYLGLLSAVLAYYIIHEGAHLIYALITGTFKQINIMGLGMQIDIYSERMTQAQLGVFLSYGLCCNSTVRLYFDCFDRKDCEDIF